MSESSLVSLATRYSHLIAKLLDQDEEELTKVLAEELDGISAQMGHKVDAYDFVLKRLEAEEAQFKHRAQEYSQAAKRCSHARDFMKRTLKEVMHSIGKTEVLGVHSAFRLSQQGTKLVIEDETLIPQEFKLLVTQCVPDKERIHTVLEGGEVVPGCRLEPIIALRSVIKANKELGEGK